MYPEEEYLKQSYSKAGVAMLRDWIQMELETQLHQTGRLYLMQCSRKMQRYKKKFPCMKTTRPIAVNSVIVKILDRLLLTKIKPIIMEVTSKYNAGFKPKMCTQM